MDGFNESATVEKSYKVEKNKIMGFIKNERSEWGLKRDIKRIILYESLDEKAIINQIGALTPSEAILLSLFDGKRTNGEVIKTAADLFQENEDRAERNIALLLLRWSCAMEEKPNGRSDTPQYNPRDFIIPASEVDVKSTRLYTPIGITFRISGDCIRECIYCNIERYPDKDTTILSLERWEQLAAEAKELDIVSIALTGGDPFCNKNILKIVECFTRRGLYPFIATKSFISREKADKLANLGIKRMQVSIDGPNKEVVDFLTGVEGTFEQTVASIKNLMNAGIQVSTNTVITVYNVLLIPELERFLMDLGVKWMNNSQFGRSAFLNGQDELFVTEKSGKWLENTLKRLHEGKKMKGGFEYNFIEDTSFKEPSQRKEAFLKRAACTGGRWGLICSADGKVIPCDEIPLKNEYVVGDLSHQSIREVWNSPRFDMYLKPPIEFFEGTACYSCETFDLCHQDKGRCFRDSLKAYGSLFAPSPTCWKADKGIRLT